MQHTFGGGAVGEGHRYVEVSKTVSQQTRPALEREISAGHRARREPRDPTALVGGAGLATAGVGAGMIGSGKRRIRRMDDAVTQARAKTDQAASSAKDAQANAHAAERRRARALQANAQAKSRQAALKQWEDAGGKMPHTTRIQFSTGRESAHTVRAPGSTSHVRARNALANQAHNSDEQARQLAGKEREELKRAQRAARDKDAFGAIHQRGVQLQQKQTPKMKARIGRGRALAIGGGLTAAGALVHGERKRGQVGKSLAEMKGAR